MAESSISTGRLGLAATSSILATSRISLFLALTFTIITAITIMKMTPNGIDRPKINGRLTDVDEEDYGLNPFATKAVD